MRCYAVIDTNVLVSALLAVSDDSATVKVMYHIFSGDITPVFCREIMDEYREVLTRRKFGFDISRINNILAAIDKYGVDIVPTPSGAVLPDMDDLPFYEVVLEKRKSDDTYLVTGNKKHFPQEPFIVTAREMIGLLEQ